LSRSIYISASASVQLDGPEFGGYVDVDFYLFGFRGYFGVPLQTIDPIDKLASVKLIREVEPATPKYPLDMVPSAKDTRHELMLSFEDGTIPELHENMHIAVDDKTHTWHVRAGIFKFRVESKFALSHFAVNDLFHSVQQWPHWPMTTPYLTNEVPLPDGGSPLTNGLYQCLYSIATQQCINEIC
jgi:hypothetical protein